MLTITRQKFCDLLGALVELLTAEFSQKVLLLAPWLQGIDMDARRVVAAKFERRECEKHVEKVVERKGHREIIPSTARRRVGRGGPLGRSAARPRLATDASGL